MTEGFGSPVAAATIYTYDLANNLLTVKDGRVHAGAFDTRNEYDALYRKIHETNGEGETTQYTYDGNNNLLSRTEPNSPAYVTYFAYDELNTLIWVDERRGGTGGVTFFLYDANRNKIAQE